MSYAKYFKNPYVIIIGLGLIFYSIGQIRGGAKKVDRISITDNYISEDLKKVNYPQFREQIKKRLKSPSTAEFSNEDMSIKNGIITYTGSVDSQNGFGAMIHNEYIMKVRRDGMKIISVDFTDL